jgi:hypothetical protein
MSVLPDFQLIVFVVYVLGFKVLYLLPLLLFSFDDFIKDPVSPVISNFKTVRGLQLISTEMLL